MSKYYGYRCYLQNGQPLGWLYTYAEGVTEKLVWTNNPQEFNWCKRWKREKTAQKHFEHYNKKFNFQSRGGYLQIELMPKAEEADTTPQRRWNQQNLEVIQLANQKYNQKRPVISFRPPSEILEWLESERWDEGKPETNAALILRKLEKLKKLESQGY